MDKLKELKELEMKQAMWMDLLVNIQTEIAEISERLAAQKKEHDLTESEVFIMKQIEELSFNGAEWFETDEEHGQETEVVHFPTESEFNMSNTSLHFVLTDLETKEMIWTEGDDVNGIPCLRIGYTPKGREAMAIIKA